MSEHAEISISSLESFRDEFENATTLLKEFRSTLPYPRSDIDDLLKSITVSIQIIDDCVKEPLHDGYLG